MVFGTQELLGGTFCFFCLFLSFVCMLLDIWELLLILSTGISLAGLGEPSQVLEIEPWFQHMKNKHSTRCTISPVLSSRDFDKEINETKSRSNKK